MKKLLLLSLALVLIASSCEKAEDLNTTKNSQTKEMQIYEDFTKDLDFGKYSKEIVVYDKTKENFALVKIGTDNEDYFKLITSDNLTILPIKQGESTEEVLSAYNNATYGESYSGEEIEEDDTLSGDGNCLHVYSAILSTSLANDVERIILVNNTPNPTKADWTISYVYGYAPSSGTNYGKQTARFIGQNRWHVGYFGLKYKRLSDGLVSTIVSDYQQIRTNDIVEKTRTDCKYMEAHLKHKGDPASVIVEFLY